MSNGFEAHIAGNARLAILEALYDQPDRSLPEMVLQKALERVGIKRSRDYVRTQLRWLKDMGAVYLLDRTQVWTATMMQTGIDHVERRSVIEGVERPQPEA